MKQGILRYSIPVIVCCCTISCAMTPEMCVSKEESILYDGKAVEMFMLTNRNGMTVRVTNFGASVTFVSAPDRNGVFEPVVLGLDSLEQYFGRQPKLGATVGRFANRIRNAEFTLDGKSFSLDDNSKGHCIHGGTKGFHTRIFNTDTIYVKDDTAAVIFSYLSPDGEGGFPGNLNLSVSYRLTNKNEMIIGYTATTDKPTVVNITNHTYFNLTGCKESVLDHQYMIDADSITPTDSEGIPTGELTSVEGTEYDFRKPAAIRQRAENRGKGYDTNYKLNKASERPELAATVTDPVSGRVLKAYTTEPGMQFYTPATDLGYLPGHSGRKYGKYYGFCLEMQHFPDSPNNDSFPSTVLRPGETYRQTTIYRFGNIL